VAAALLLVRSVAPLKVGLRIAVGYISARPMLDGVTLGCVIR
jgi:hypothetical protein